MYWICQDREGMSQPGQEHVFPLLGVPTAAAPRPPPQEHPNTLQLRYLGLLQELAALLILDVGDLPVLDLKGRACVTA